MYFKFKFQKMLEVNYFKRINKKGEKQFQVHEFDGEVTFLKIFPESLEDEEMNFNELSPLTEDEFLDECLEEGVFN